MDMLDQHTRRELLRKAAAYEAASLEHGPHLAGLAAALRALAGQRREPASRAAADGPPTRRGCGG